MKFPIPQDWDGETWCRWAVCWPSSEHWEGFLRGLLTLPQRGRTWDEKTGSILDIQQIGREITEANLPLNGVVMACNDTGLQESFADIALALRYLADRQFTKPCCHEGVNVVVNATGFAGTTTQPVGLNTIPIYGDSPPAQLPEGETIPTGFTNQEEWSVHKCAVANQIFDGVLFTLSGLATISLINVSVLGVIALAAIPGILVFPPAAIVTMIGALLVLVGIQETLLQVKDLLIDHRQDAICIMVTWDNVSVIIGYLADFMDFIIALAAVTGPVGIAIKTILLLLFNGDALNKLFDSTADYSYPGADCSACRQCTEFFYTFESGTDEFGSVNNVGCDYEPILDGSTDLEAIDGILNVAVSGGALNTNGAFGKIGIEYQVGSGTVFRVELRLSGASSVYLDVILVYSDDSCEIQRLSSNHAANSVFEGLNTVSLEGAGKWVNKVYIYMASSNAGPDESFLVEFDQVGFLCP